MCYHKILYGVSTAAWNKYNLLSIELNILGQYCISYYLSDIVNYSSTLVYKPDWIIESPAEF